MVTLKRHDGLWLRYFRYDDFVTLVEFHQALYQVHGDIQRLSKDFRMTKLDGDG
jgi:hypothetical protein